MKYGFPALSMPQQTIFLVTGETLFPVIDVLELKLLRNIPCFIRRYVLFNFSGHSRRYFSQARPSPYLRLSRLWCHTRCEGVSRWALKARLPNPAEAEIRQCSPTSLGGLWRRAVWRFVFQNSGRTPEKPWIVAGLRARRERQ
jgi:hypothetical protein